MCLVLPKNYHKIIASKDITCYKHLLYSENSEIYITPYRGCQVKIGETYESEIEVKLSGKYIIDKALHSFKLEIDCRNDQREDLKMIKLKPVICRCIIPAGSEYYIGIFSSSLCLASNRLKYLEII